jgi:hypothetical protein
VANRTTGVSIVGSARAMIEYVEGRRTKYILGSISRLSLHLIDDWYRTYGMVKIRD